MNSSSVVEFDNEDLTVCHYSKVSLHGVVPIVLGSVVPQASCRFLCHPLLGPEAFKSSRLEFERCEGNCNTCVHLERIKTAHKRNPHEPHTGICKSPNQDMVHHPYSSGIQPGTTIFHPDDSMNMSCFKHRRD